MELSQRLSAVARYAPKGSVVADIGSDHAFLPIYLIKTGKSPRAIVGELNPGPLAVAEKNVREAGVSDRVDLRLGDGLSVIENGEADTVCISGMGGTLIVSILEAGKERLRSVRTLILQPNVAAKNVRKWLYDNGWELTGETILREDGIIYEVLCAIPGDPQAPYRSERWSLDQWFEIGPFLWRQSSPIFKEKWERELEQAERALKGLAQAKSKEAEIRKKTFEERVQWIKEVLACTQTVKQSSK